MRIKVYLLSLLMLGVFALAPMTVHAQNMEAMIAQQAGYDVNSTDEFTVSKTIGQIIKSVLSFVGTIFLALTVYAGILWMTASGNDDQVSKAIGIIKMAVTGFVITMSAYSIVYFVMFFSAPQQKKVSAKNCCAAANSVYGSNAFNTKEGDSSAARVGKAVMCGLTAVSNVVNPYAWFVQNKTTSECK